MVQKKKTRDAEATRDRIVDAAIALFKKHGYAKTSTRQVAKVAGVAHGTVFFYAPTKEDLVFLVFEDVIVDAFDAALTRAVDGAFSDRASALFESLFDAYGHDAALGAVLLKELMWVGNDDATRTRLLELNARLMGALAGFAQDDEDAGRLRAGQVYLLVGSAAGLYLAWLTSWLSNQVDKDTALHALQAGLVALSAGLAP
jgi:TetR/AcrR family transcriptional regulator